MVWKTDGVENLCVAGDVAGRSDKGGRLTEACGGIYLLGSQGLHLRYRLGRARVKMCGHFCQYPEPRKSEDGQGERGAFSIGRGKGNVGAEEMDRSTYT